MHLFTQFTICKNLAISYWNTESQYPYAATGIPDPHKRIEQSSGSVNYLYISTVLWLLNKSLFLKTGVNVPTWSTVTSKYKNNWKQKLTYFFDILKVSEEKSRIRIRNPVVRIRIHIRTSRIRKHCYAVPGSRGGWMQPKSEKWEKILGLSSLVFQ